MRASMMQLTPRFSANRAVRDYTEQYYLPAAKKFHERALDHGALGQKIVNWKGAISSKWGKLRFNELKMTKEQDRYEVEVQVYLDGLAPDFVKIQVYGNSLGDQRPYIQEMKLLRQLSGELHSYIYTASVSADRSENEYTVRMIPFFPTVSIPLEDDHVLWQK